MIFDKTAETASMDYRRKMQLKYLQNVIDYCYTHVPFYHERLKNAGIRCGAELSTLEDIQYIPFTTKQDLIDNYPDGLLAVPMSDVVRIHASSGTTGKPMIGYYTKKDLKVWRLLAARVLALNGLKKEDIFQVSVSYGLFTGAFGFHQGAEELGCTIVPASTGNTEKQLLMMRDLKVSAITATPSYAVLLAERIKNQGDLSAYNLKRVLFGAERCTKKVRKEVEKILSVETADNYGLTEFFGPGVAGECSCQCGLHISEDYFYPEIVDETGTPLPDGIQGELIFTSLQKEAMPLLRYRTRDITTLDHAPCRCGRTTVRMQAPFARTDEMFVLKGVNVFPGQIECAMEGIEGISPHYHVTVKRENYTDSALLSVELVQDQSNYTQEEYETIRNALVQRLKEILAVRLQVELVNPGSLERSYGKAKRVSDLRYVME